VTIIGAAVWTEAPLRTPVGLAGREGEAPDVLLGTTVPFPDGPPIPGVPVLELTADPVVPDGNLELDPPKPPVPVAVPVRVIFRMLVTLPETSPAPLLEVLELASTHRTSAASRRGRGSSRALCRAAGPDGRYGSNASREAVLYGDRRAWLTHATVEQ